MAFGLVLGQPPDMLGFAVSGHCFICPLANPISFLVPNLCKLSCPFPPTVLSILVCRDPYASCA